jgi:uncharacterized membrane protein
MNIFPFIFPVTPSSEMPKAAAVSMLLVAFILVSITGYFKTIITITVIYLGLKCT